MPNPFQADRGKLDRLKPTRDFSQGAEAALLIITNKANNGKENKAGW